MPSPVDETLTAMTSFEAAAAYLQRHEPWPDAVDAMKAACRSVFAAADFGGSSPVALDVDALVGTEPTQPLLNVLRPWMPVLSWRQNPTYTVESFLCRYVYCELVGPSGLAFHATVSIGLLYLAPGTLYPPHAHPAEEAYHLLAGVSEWRVGTEPLVLRSPGDRVEHPSGVAHSMRSGPTPMLALYVWRGDLATPAQFVSAVE